MQGFATKEELSTLEDSTTKLSHRSEKHSKEIQSILDQLYDIKNH